MAIWKSWKCKAEYADGTKVQEAFPYEESGNRDAEQHRKNELECYLLMKRHDCISYSVRRANT